MSMTLSTCFHTVTLLSLDFRPLCVFISLMFKSAKRIAIDYQLAQAMQTLNLVLIHNFVFVLVKSKAP